MFASVEHQEIKTFQRCTSLQTDIKRLSVGRKKKKLNFYIDSLYIVGNVVKTPDYCLPTK